MPLQYQNHVANCMSDLPNTNRNVLRRVKQRLVCPGFDKARHCISFEEYQVCRVANFMGDSMSCVKKDLSAPDLIKLDTVFHLRSIKSLRHIFSQLKSMSNGTIDLIGLMISNLFALS